ncbi:MAG: branched-chain amino acid ABC transporter permease [Desulfobacteraceae bacterium]|nr:MAG: branched-chain amino acid ABC transporter permease [Desulfobacteraceae bacterium]
MVRLASKKNVDVDTRTPFIWTAVCILLLLVPLFSPRFYVYIFSLIFVTALLAMSLNLVVGHGGLYQFHHGVFYGIGAYTYALLATRTELPVYFGFVAAPLVSAFFGFLIGLFCVRLTKLYFGMLQISLGSLIWAVAFRWYALTGGDDGIHGVPVPDLLQSPKEIYYFTLIVLGACLFVLYRILNSPFGTTLWAIRDNPERCSAVGIDVRRHRMVAIVISAFFAGVAGALFVMVEGSVFPDLLFWVLSLEIFIMCLLGGWYTFAGPMLGAAVIVSLRTFAGTYTEYWTSILGIILILLIFFLPEGIMGFLEKKLGSSKEGKGRARA